MPYVVFLQNYDRHRLDELTDVIDHFGEMLVFQRIARYATDDEIAAGYPNPLPPTGGQGPQDGPWVYQQLYGDNLTTEFTITHQMYSDIVSVQVQEESTKDEWHPAVTAKTQNTVTLTHSIAPTLNQFRVIVRKLSTSDA